MSGSVIWASVHFWNASTNAVYLPRIPSWVHWYMCCIVSGVMPQFRQGLVVVCLNWFRIVIVGRVLLMNFLIKRSMWSVVVYHNILNFVKSISSQSAMWVRFWSFHRWSIWRLYILYAIYWVILKCTGSPCIDTLGITCGSKSPSPRTRWH